MNLDDKIRRELGEVGPDEGPAFDPDDLEEPHPATATPAKRSGPPPLPARFVAELGDDALAVEPPPRAFLLRREMGDRSRGWLPSGIVGLLASAGGAGKTTALCQLAVSVATGRRWLGCDVVSPGSVLLVLAEEPETEVRRKLHLASRLLGLDSQAREVAAMRIAFVSLVGKHCRLLEADRRGNVTEAPLLGSLRGFLEERATDWRLVVLDPFARFCAAEAELDNAIASETVRAAASLTEAPGNPTVLLAHHMTKAARDGEPELEGVRGAGAITDESRWAAVLWGDRKDPLAAYLRCKKSNYAPKGDRLSLRRDKGGALRVASPAEEAAAEEFGAPS